jgi:hypothetical protein
MKKIWGLKVGGSNAFLRKVIAFWACSIAWLPLEFKNVMKIIEKG